MDQMNDFDNEQELNPVSYLKILFRRKWMVIMPMFVGLVIGIVAAFLMPKTYESSTLVLVQEEKVINPLIQGIAISTSVADRMSTIREQVLSWNNLVKLTENLKMAKNVSSQIGFEQLIKTLRKNIAVRMKGGNLITIAYQSPKPIEAQKVVQALTDLFIQQNILDQTKETDVAIKFIKDQLKVYKRKIKESEIATLQDELNTLLADSTESHPLVKDYREKIALGKKELQSKEFDVDPDSMQPIPDPIYNRIKSELDQLKQEQKTSGGILPTAEANTGVSMGPDIGAGSTGNLYSVLLMDKLDTVMARDARINENMYNTLLQRLESAKITQRLEASKEGTRYSILDPARLPLKPAKPNKFLVSFMGMLFGCMCGVGIVVGAEVMDNSILDVEEAKRSFDMPLLGAISRIMTPEEAEQEKAKKKTMVTAFLLVGAAVVVIVILAVFLTRP